MTPSISGVSTPKIDVQTRQGLALIAVDVELDAVAVVLDLMTPIDARRGFHPETGELRLDEARHRRA